MSDRHIKYIKTAAFLLVEVLLIFLALLALLNSEGNSGVEVMGAACFLLAIVLLLENHRRRTARCAYNAFIMLRENSQDYGCAITCRKDIFDTNKAYCPLNSMKFKRMHGYDETITLDGMSLVLNLEKGLPCIYVDIFGALLSSIHEFDKLPDKLCFSLKTEGEGDTAASGRIKAGMKCDEIYYITYGSHELRILIYDDKSKEALLSKAGFII